MSVLILLLCLGSISFAEEWKFKLPTQFGADTRNVKALEYFAELVEERTEGRMKIDIYVGGALGGEKDNLESIRLGTIEMGNIGTAIAILIYVPRSNIWFHLYMWDSAKQFSEFCNTPEGQAILNEFTEKSNVKILTFDFRELPRHVVTKKKPAYTPKDLNGVKIRYCEGMETYRDGLAAMGASPVPIAWPELFSAFQTGVIDAVELPYDWLIFGGAYQIGKYITLTAHVYDTSAIMINNDLFESLPEDIQDILVKSAEEVADYCNKLMEGEEGERRKFLEEAGLEFIEPDIELFRAPVRALHEDYAKQFEGGLELFEAIKEFREAH